MATTPAKVAFHDTPVVVSAGHWSCVHGCATTADQTPLSWQVPTGAPVQPGMQVPLAWLPVGVSTQFALLNVAAVQLF